MQKSIYKKARRDKRVREYLPASRVVWSQKLENPDFFCGNEDIQPVFDGEFNAIKFEKGSSVLIDFGIELHGGVRIVNAGGRGRVRLRFGESVSEAIGNPNQDHTIHDTELMSQTPDL